MSHEIHNYTELEQQIHDDLRSQHPDWIKPDGKCPECDEHEARLKELLEALERDQPKTEPRQKVSVPDRTNPGSP